MGNRRGLWFSFIDAVEDDRSSPPRVYLFGKVLSASKEFVSCCLVAAQKEIRAAAARERATDQTKNDWAPCSTVIRWKPSKEVYCPLGEDNTKRIPSKRRTS